MLPSICHAEALHFFTEVYQEMQAAGMGLCRLRTAALPRPDSLPFAVIAATSEEYAAL